MVNLLDVAKRAREILTPREAWIKGSYAKATPDGSSVPTFLWVESIQKYIPNPEAVCFCSLGAVRRAIAELGGNDRDASDASQDFMKQAAHCVPQRYRVIDLKADVVGFNDDPERTHEQVLAMFDCTIANMEAEVAHA